MGARSCHELSAGRCVLTQPGDSRPRGIKRFFGGAVPLRPDVPDREPTAGNFDVAPVLLEAEPTFAHFKDVNAEVPVGRIDRLNDHVFPGHTPPRDVLAPRRYFRIR